MNPRFTMARLRVARAGLVACMSFGPLVAQAPRPSCTEIDALRARKEQVLRDQKALAQRLATLVGEVPDAPKDDVEKALAGHRQIAAARAKVGAFDNDPQLGMAWKRARSSRNPLNEGIEDAEFWADKERKANPQLSKRVDDLTAEVARLEAEKAQAAPLAAKRAELQRARSELYTQETLEKLAKLPEWTRKRDELNLTIEPLYKQRRALLDALAQLIDDHQKLPCYTLPTPELERLSAAWRERDAKVNASQEAMALERDRVRLDTVLATITTEHDALLGRLEAQVRTDVEDARKKADLGGLKYRLLHPQPAAEKAAKAAAAAQPAIVTKRRQLQQRLQASPSERAAVLQEWTQVTKAAVGQQLRLMERERLLKIRDALPSLPCSEEIAGFLREVAVTLRESLGPKAAEGGDVVAPAASTLPDSLALPFEEK